MSDSLPRALRAVILVAVSSLGVPIGCGTTKTVQLRELSNDALKATVSRQERTESFVKEVGGGGGRGAIPIPSCNGCNACASRLSPEISYVLALRGARNTKITLACEPTQLRLQAEGRAVAYACAENSAPSPASRTDASGSTWHRLRFAKDTPFEDVDPEHAADAPLESLPPLSMRALALSGDTGAATSSPETLELLLGEVERQEGATGTATVLAALLGSPATKYSVQFGNDDTYARRREDRAVAAVRGAFLAIAKEERAAATVTQAARTALTNANGDPVVLRWALGIVSPSGRGPVRSQTPANLLATASRETAGPLPQETDDRKALAAALPALGARLRKARPEDKGLTRDWLARQVQFDPAQAATVACAEMSEKAPFLTKESIALALAAGGVEETARRGAGACGHAVADTFFPPEVVCKANATEPRTDAELREVLTTWRASSDVEPPLPYPELAYLAGVENGLAPMLARRFARQTYAPPPEDPAVPACGNSLENGVACACLPTALQLCVADPKTTEIVGDHCVITADDAGKRLHHPRNVCAKTGEACAGYDRCCGYAACTGGICGPRSVAAKDAGASPSQDGAP